ncbi:MAG TPA: alkaline phosphatase family protein [Bradyrhizobium sp.]|jgi:phospholipase C|nr:alkaline phosphatase family protein [Bradyrhizobium sp.]
MRLPTALGLVSALALAVAGAGALADDRAPTATPIKHVVVIFQENVSFDHYFGTYPNALNLSGETPFTASPRTPRANNLANPLDVNQHFKPLAGVDLLHNNPNSNPTNPAAPNNSKMNGGGASNPFRLSPSQALTADQGHNENQEESAYNNGRMDGFPAFVGAAGPPPVGIGSKALVMGYFDGNTVTAMWNYAQHFALNDNNYSTQFGPSTPGALNLISGQANGFSATLNVLDPSGKVLLHPTHEAFGDAQQTANNITEIGDGDPLLDACSNPAIDQITMAGKNIGDLLNDHGITWGAFMGGFDLTVVNADGTTGCLRHTNPTAPGTPQFTSADYIPHHAWFQYYASTRNPSHARPSSVQAIGHSLIPHTNTPDPANHQYDIRDFFTALQAGNLPAVSFLKAAAFEDGHAGYSDPLDEQHFLVRVLNALQKSPEWSETAVIILYDDSDGWYDHQMPPIVNPSFNTVVDTLNGPGVCSTSNGFQQDEPVSTTPLNGNFGKPAWGRCGYGTRMPLLVVSPFARRNHVDHTLTDQTSVLRFIEDNWLSGQRIQHGGSFDAIAGPLNNMFDFDDRDDNGPRKLLLDEKTGVVVSASRGDGDGHGRH